MIKYLNIKPSFYILFKDNNRIIEYNFFSLMSESIDPELVKAISSNKEDLDAFNDTLNESSDRGRLKKLRRIYNTRLGEYANDSHWQSLPDKVKSIWKQRVLELETQMKELEEQINSQEVSTTSDNSQDIELVFLSEDKITEEVDENTILSSFLNSKPTLTNVQDSSNLKNKFTDIRYGGEEYYDDKLYGTIEANYNFTDSTNKEHEIMIVFDAEIDFNDTTRITPKVFPPLKSFTNIKQVINRITWVEVWLDGNQVVNISPDNVKLLDNFKNL